MHCFCFISFSYIFSFFSLIFSSFSFHFFSGLAFVAGLKRATDEGSLPEISQYSPYYLSLNIFIASKGSNLYISFAITAAGVVLCGGPYIIHSAVYIFI